MANNVVIAIKTKLDSKGLKQLQTEASKAQKSIGKAFGQLGPQIIAADALKSLTTGVADFVLESASLASEASRIESAFLNLSGGSEKAAANMMALQSATHGLTSEMEAQEIANQLMGMQIVSTSEELEKVVGVASRLGGTFRGLGAKEAAEEFAIMMSNMSVQRLDSFGISSGRVKKRMEELQKSGAAATKEAAFFQATMAEADETLARLGPRVETTADQMAGLKASTTDFKVAFGELLTAGGEGGLIGWVDGWVESLTEGAKAWTGVFDTMGLFSDALDIQTASLNDATGGWLEWAESIPGVGGLIQTGEVVAQLAFNHDEFAESVQEAAAAQDTFNESMEATPSAAGPMVETKVEVNQDLIDAQQDTARSLIKINEDAAAEIPEIWDEFFDGVGDAWETFREELAKVEEDGAKEQLKIEEDLAKDLERVKTDLVKSLASIDKDLSKSLAKTSAKEQKDVLKKQTSFSKERVREEKRRQIDTLADQRLFDFELRNLAADGQGNRIRELLERREIEQAISQEKNALESQIDQEKHSEEITAIKETASERRNQLILDAAEDRAQKTQDAAEEKERLKVAAEEAQIALQEELDERRQAIQDNLTDELAALDESRVEKLAANEEGRKESISALARGLAETQDLTEEELSKVAEIAGRLGEDAGVAFADGLAKGAATNQMVENLITGTTPSSPAARPGTGFKNGGSFTVGGSGGPDSQLVAFNATPGERVSISPQGQGGGVTVNVNGVGAADLAAILQNKVSEGIQEYNDNHIVPALTGL